MFTGIIEQLGTIRRVATGNGMRLSIRATRAMDTTRVGDSIAVSGACLTVVSLSGADFDVDVSPETVKRTTLGQARPGLVVNLERALPATGRLDGHLVLGHVDGTGTVTDVTKTENALVIAFEADPALTRYMVDKGSVAIDGISLTVNTVRTDGFSVAIIPHTAAVTTIGQRRPGDRVNLETDIIGKYVEKLLATKDTTVRAGGIDREFLAKTGFA